MSREQLPSIFTVSVFTRHSPDCSKRDNPQWKRCTCRKSLYLYENGKVSYKSARTRSWEKAEQLAQAERDARDPVKLKLREIAEREASKAAKEEDTISVPEALDQWNAGQKHRSHSRAKAYRLAIWKIKNWANENNLWLLRDVTPALLYKWRGEWSPVAKRCGDRMGTSSQNQHLSLIKAFFSWATRVELINRDPSTVLKPSPVERVQTTPLTREQFKEVIVATYAYDEKRPPGGPLHGRDMRAILLLQRWTGLRIIDVLMLPRSGIQGNRLKLKTQKTRAEVDRILPDEVVAAFSDLPQRSYVHPDYFFWSKGCKRENLTVMWVGRVRRLNKHLSLVDERGQLLPFRSHMLRDTYAVEMLLAGVPLEKLSRLLTHESVRVTEKYYAPWVKSRQQHLEDESIAAMRKMGATITMPMDSQTPDHFGAA
jgi:integrase/recombinase XerD